MISALFIMSTKEGFFFIVVFVCLYVKDYKIFLNTELIFIQSFGGMWRDQRENRVHFGAELDLKKSFFNHSDIGYSLGQMFYFFCKNCVCSWSCSNVLGHYTNR